MRPEGFSIAILCLFLERSQFSKEIVYCEGTERYFEGSVHFFKSAMHYLEVTVHCFEGMCITLKEQCFFLHVRFCVDSAV